MRPWNVGKKITGPVEAGVQGVPRHTKYLALHLVKTKFIPENSGVGYLLVCTPNVQWLPLALLGHDCMKSPLSQTNK